MRPSASKHEGGSTSTSRSLLRHLHDRDPDAWERLVTLYAPLVWHWCRKSGLPTQDATDLLQDVFQAVAAHFDHFRRDRPGDTFRGWLRTITRNKLRDHFRKRQNQPDALGGTAARAWWSGLPDAEDLDDADASPENHLLYRRALSLIQDGFEEKTWKAFCLVVIDGKSAQEAAAELGMTPAAVRVAKCRVLQRLRQELGDLGEP